MSYHRRLGSIAQSIADRVRDFAFNLHAKSSNLAWRLLSSVRSSKHCRLRKDLSCVTFRILVNFI